MAAAAVGQASYSKPRAAHLRGEAFEQLQRGGVLGWVLASATHRTVAEYMEELVWKPIGAEHDGMWLLDHRGGQEKVSTGWNATARDYAKFGLLYLNGGAWNGRQVVPADWVAASVGYDGTRAAPEVVTWWGMPQSRFECSVPSPVDRSFGLQDHTEPPVMPWPASG